MIELSHITKTFKHYRVHRSLKQYIIQRFGRSLPKPPVEKRTTVIQDFSVAIPEGAIVGILGKNGAGKSTLAKMIAGTMIANEGNIATRGTIVPFLELGVAFNDELTGKDNVILNGLLLGVPHKTLQNKMDDIFAYAEVSEFKHTPLKFYSSGMRLRLAYAVAKYAQGDIFIFDEILAVGDAGFKQKCFDNFNELIKNKKTILLISHDLESIEKYATMVIAMKPGSYEIITDQARIKNLSKDNPLDG